MGAASRPKGTELPSLNSTLRKEYYFIGFQFMLATGVMENVDVVAKAGLLRRVTKSPVPYGEFNMFDNHKMCIGEDPPF